MTDFRPPVRLPSLSRLAWLQGSPADLTHNHQLLLLIQPNCPGCHTHAIPLANQLIQTTKRDFDVYCISTAFEDFEYNTEEAARLLLAGKHVGVAREQLGETALHVPQMPLAHDIVVEKGEASADDITKALDATKYAAYDQMQGRTSLGVLERQIEKLGESLLPDFIAEVFYSVRASGTPTWVVHNTNGEVLGVKLGQMEEPALLEWMDQLQK
jgi:hypothetical protein